MDKIRPQWSTCLFSKNTALTIYATGLDIVQKLTFKRKMKIKVLLPIPKAEHCSVKYNKNCSEFYRHIWGGELNNSNTPTQKP